MTSAIAVTNITFDDWITFSIKFPDAWNYLLREASNENEFNNLYPDAWAFLADRSNANELDRRAMERIGELRHSDNTETPGDTTCSENE